MKKYVAMVSVLLVLGLSLFVTYKTLRVPVTPVHYHANFAVFIDGAQVDFTKPSYMHIQPCTNDEKESSDPEENVHLHDQVGNVVHLHMASINWHTFFSAIHYDLLDKTNEKSMSVYSRGEKVSSQYLYETIRKQDQVLIHIASQSGAQSVSSDPLLQKEQQAVGDTATTYDEGKVGVEKCGTTGDRSFFQRFKIAFAL